MTEMTTYKLVPETLLKALERWREAFDGPSMVAASISVEVLQNEFDTFAASPASPAVGEEELALRHQPAECSPSGCDDTECPYAHFESWHVGRERFDTELEALRHFHERASAILSRTPAQSDERIRELEAEVDRMKERLRENADKRARIAASLAEARKVIGAAQGHLLNALIDLQTSTPKKTTIGTIEGGIKITRDWLSRNSEQSNG